MNDGKYGFYLYTPEERWELIGEFWIFNEEVIFFNEVDELSISILPAGHITEGTERLLQALLLGQSPRFFISCKRSQWGECA